MQVAAQAGDAIAETEGDQGGAEYLSEATYTCGMAGSSPHGWTLAARGSTMPGPVETWPGPGWSSSTSSAGRGAPRASGNPT